MRQAAKILFLKEILILVETSLLFKSLFQSLKVTHTSVLRLLASGIAHNVYYVKLGAVLYCVHNRM